MKNSLDRIFKLPPIEDRRMSHGWLTRTFLPPRFTKYSDDTYIYYQCARTSFFISAILIFLAWISLLTQWRLDFYFFAFDIPNQAFIEPFFRQLTYPAARILMFLVVPFYLIKLFYNIKPKQVDLLWWNYKLKKETRKSRIKMISLLLFLLLPLSIAFYHSYAFSMGLMNYHPYENWHTSYIFCILLTFFHWMILSTMPMMINVLIILIYRYIGPYSQKLSSNSIREGKQE